MKMQIVFFYVFPENGGPLPPPPTTPLKKTVEDACMDLCLFTFI